jgi:hypothetical protein
MLSWKRVNEEVGRLHEVRTESAVQVDLSIAGFNVSVQRLAHSMRLVRQTEVIVEQKDSRSLLRVCTTVATRDHLRNDSVDERQRKDGG